MERQFFVYILTNSRHTVLYTGVTNDLVRRVHEHRNKQVRSFTARYNVDMLVYFEVATNALTAIAREKQIKGGSRQRKLAIIETINPTWRDLYADIT